MYRITNGIHINFGHHVRGHDGPCISLHGHTWLFEVTLGSTELDKQGFVADFDVLGRLVLEPCHRLLDHSLAMGEATWHENRKILEELGRSLVASRQETLGNLGEPQVCLSGELGGAKNERPGGIKVAVFPFTPTSEKLARWLFEASEQAMANDRVKVISARIYETLHPVESVAEYTP